MGRFDKEYVSADTQDGIHHRLTSGLSYTTNGAEIISVPEKFWTDGASVPRVLWRLYPPFGKYFRAAIIHDYMYFRGEFVRSKCDRIFREAVLACGCSKVTAFNLYIGVRVGGWIAYGKYRKKEKSK